MEFHGKTQSFFLNPKNLPRCVVAIAQGRESDATRFPPFLDFLASNFAAANGGGPPEAAKVEAENWFVFWNGRGTGGNRVASDSLP